MGAQRPSKSPELRWPCTCWADSIAGPPPVNPQNRAGRQSLVMQAGRMHAWKCLGGKRERKTTILLPNESL